MNIRKMLQPENSLSFFTLAAILLDEFRQFCFQRFWIASRFELNVIVEVVPTPRFFKILPDDPRHCWIRKEKGELQVRIFGRPDHTGNFIFLLIAKPDSFSYRIFTAKIFLRGLFLHHGRVGFLQCRCAIPREQWIGKQLKETLLGCEEIIFFDADIIIAYHTSPISQEHPAGILNFRKIRFHRGTDLRKGCSTFKHLSAVAIKIILHAVDVLCFFMKIVIAQFILHVLKN